MPEDPHFSGNEDDCEELEGFPNDPDAVTRHLEYFQSIGLLQPYYVARAREALARVRIRDANPLTER